jgi:hypothetical protein
VMPAGSCAKFLPHFANPNICILCALFSLISAHLHRNEVQTEFHCSVSLLRLFGPWTRACCSCCLPLPIIWNVQRHASVCSGGYPKRLRGELHYCSYFRGCLESFLDAGPLHAHMHDCWNQLDQPGLGQPIISTGSWRPGYLKIGYFQSNVEGYERERAPYLLQISSRSNTRLVELRFRSRVKLLTVSFAYNNPRVRTRYLVIVKTSNLKASTTVKN